MTDRPKSPAFSLVELLAALTIVAVLAVLVLTAGRQAVSGAQKSDSLGRLRSLGQAVLTYAGEHDAQLPGPLWPGQVLLYDATESGRLVVRLAPYLGIEPRETPYLVERLIPKAYLRKSSAGPVEDLRVYVMNISVVQDGQTNRPFGSLTATPVAEPQRLGQLPPLPPAERWMISETDQRHSEVSGAPWKAHTPADPVHDGFRASVDFDGSARLEKAP